MPQADQCAVTVPLPEPVAVWDVHSAQDSLYWHHHREVSVWATENLPDRAISITRVEFYLLDCPFAVIHEVARDGDGRCVIDLKTGTTAMAAPRTVLLDALPPAELLR